MAINDLLQGVEVVIMIEGQPAKEYTDDTEAPSGPHADKTVLKYIECHSDTCFQIHSNIAADYAGAYSLIFVYRLDGKKGLRSGCFNVGRSVPRTIVRRGFENGVLGENTQLMIPFKFSEVEIVDDINQEQVIDDTTVAEGLGEIVVEVYRCVYLSQLTLADSAEDIRKAKALNGYALSEKSIKGRNITHGIAHGAFGEGVVRPLTPHCSVSFIDEMDKPVAVFKFRYRSRAALEAALIIDQFEDMSPEELRRHARQLARERRAAQKVVVKQEIKTERGIKRERTDDDDEPAALTADGPTSKRVKVVVDLTDD